MPWRRGVRIIASMTTNRAEATSVPVPRNATPERDGIVVGTGPVDVDAYIDFQCPFCKQFELMSRSTIDSLLASDMIRFIRHPMNFLDEVSTTAYSTRAAAASAAASDAGLFHEYAQALFEFQPPEGGPGLSDDQLIALGQQIGISDPGFERSIREGTYLPWPPYVTELAYRRGIGGTPSVFVAGVPVAPRPGTIVAAVKQVLS